MESVARIAGKPSNVIVPDHFKRQLDSLGAHSIHAQLQEAGVKVDFDNGQFSTAKFEELASRHAQIQSTHKLLLRSYSECYKDRKRLLDDRRAEIRADLIDRFRLLLFRMITAIGIATVVLGTGYVADKFGIPLPLLHL